MNKKLIVGVVGMAALIIGLYATKIGDGITGFTIGEPEIPVETGSIDVYFAPRDNVDSILVDYINNAQDVKCAFYDLDLENVIGALEQKNADVLVDEDYYFGLGTIVTGSGLMHNKFCVLDSSIVITGSTNPTDNGAYKNNNNMLVIESDSLVMNYLDEFAELKKNADKEKKKKDASKRVRFPEIVLNGYTVENYFCPEDACEEHVLEILEGAEQSIYFMTFSFTSDPIGQMLVDRYNLGVDVRGIFENRQKSQYSEHHKLEDAGIEYMFDRNKNTMHHKVFIVDREIVITGSYNPTANGNTRNDENVLIIHDPAIALEYMEEFEHVWNYGLETGDASGAEGQATPNIFYKWEDDVILGSE